jgi:anti-sigma factor ChrR (cupin superfamily)
MSAESKHPELLAAWADGLEASLALPGQHPAVRKSLLDRVAASARAHAEYLTVRRENTPWEPLAAGVQRRRLRADPHFEVDLLRLDDGATVPQAAGACADECLLIEGCLHDAASGRTLPAHSHAVRPPQSSSTSTSTSASASALRAAGPALVYRRTLRVKPSELPPLAAAWWQTGLASANESAARRCGAWLAPGTWVHSRAGVQALPLAVQANVVSMLVRFEAGAGVPDHGHALDEDCLLLQGEMFLGDILLRAGDYQLAPAGGTHFGETSETGALFFFHGALDEALRGRSS